MFRFSDNSDGLDPSVNQEITDSRSTHGEKWLICFSDKGVRDAAVFGVSCVRRRLSQAEVTGMARLGRGDQAGGRWVVHLSNRKPTVRLLVYDWTHPDEPSSK